MVITRYPTSASQLRDGFDGVVVPMDNDGCAMGIAKLLGDPQKRNELTENCRRGDYANICQAQRLMALAEEC